MALLTFHKGGAPLFKYPITSGSIKVGRDGGNDVVLPDEGISREHAEFFFDKGDLKVRDLSRNGTLVNKREVAIEKLKSGDIVRIGKWDIVSHYVSDEEREVTVPANCEDTKVLDKNSSSAAETVDAFEVGVRHKNGNTTRRKFTQTSVTIGSGADNDIVLAGDGYISKRHCKLEFAGGKLYILDLASTNGVIFEGEKFDRMAVNNRAKFSIGKTEITVQLKAKKEKASQGEMIGRSKEILKIFSLIKKVAPTLASVLITGESGTGKELVARGIHELSTRSRAPFVAINCGAIPANMIESELFGHEKGSFTGAVEQHQGVFEQASGGTLFLDEIGEMPMELQTRLLRALENRTIRRVGGKIDIPVDVRVVAATNQNLKENLESGTFREDLFYRLYVMHVNLPPLRERKDDVEALAEHFAEMFSVDNKKISISKKAMNILYDHDWPGNIRELKNTIQRAVILSSGGTIMPEHVVLTDVSGKNRPAPLVDQEKEAILDALGNFAGNQVKAAVALGISRTTLSLKIKKFKINLQQISNSRK